MHETSICLFFLSLFAFHDKRHTQLFVGADKAPHKLTSRIMEYNKSTTASTFLDEEPFLDEEDIGGSASNVTTSPVPSSSTLYNQSSPSSSLSSLTEDSPLLSSIRAEKTLPSSPFLPSPSNLQMPLPAIPSNTSLSSSSSTPKPASLDHHFDHYTYIGENFLNLLPYQVAKLFSVYRFKGFGLAVVKPLLKLKQAAVGVKVPITANFPEYDKTTILPRISGSFHVYYPLDFRAGLSVSIPFNHALKVIIRTLLLLHLAPKSFHDKIMNLRPTDNLMRVGCSLSLYLNSERGFRATFGPWASYLPSLKTMLRILPMIFYTPALMAAITSNVFHLQDLLLGYFNKHPAPAFKPNLYPGWPYRPPRLSPSVTSPNRQLATSSTIIEQDNNSKKDITQWLHILIHWGMRKTAGTLWSFGYYMRSYSGSTPLGSGVSLDLQPFHPRGKPAVRRARTVVSSGMGSSRDNSNVNNNHSGGSINSDMGNAAPPGVNAPNIGTKKLS